MNNTSILQPDDFKEGMFITAIDFKEKPTPPQFEMVDSPIQEIMMMKYGQNTPSKSQFETLKGAVIRIDAINLPFIMVTIFESVSRPGKLPESCSIPLDVREFSFIKLNQNYVDAYMGKGPLAHLLQGQDFNSLQNMDIDTHGYNTLKELFDSIMSKIDNKGKGNKNEG